MKLTEAKLKQLILEQMNEDEFGQLNELIEYLQSLQKFFSSLPEDIQFEIDVHLREESGIISYIKGLDHFRSPLRDRFQAAIDSLALETEEPSTKKEWHFITISRWYNVGESGLPGDIESELKIYRDGTKRFVVTQFDREENELFNYYEGNDISTRGLDDFMTSDEEKILEFAKEHIEINGKTTLDSSTL